MVKIPFLNSQGFSSSEQKCKQEVPLLEIKQADSFRLEIFFGTSSISCARSVLETKHFSLLFENPWELNNEIFTRKLDYIYRIQRLH